MAIRKTSDSNLTGKKYNDASAGNAKIADVPEVPTIGTATNVGTGRAYNNGAATVAVTANAKGGIPISYTVASNPGSFIGTGSSPVTVTGLQSGVSYTFTAKAVGGSTPSETVSSSATSAITATTVPQAPTAGTATKTNVTTVSIPFTVNATGGSSITSYLVQSTPSIALTVSGSSSPLTVTGSFAQNQAYTFDVIAVNANGSSLGGTTNSITPNAIPTADADTFNRTTSLTLGATTTSGQSWTNRAGVWYANGSQAQSDSAVPALATITMNSQNGLTQAGTLTPGTGLVYWATDANRYMASYSFSADATSNSCGGYTSAACYSNGCTPSGCCTGVTRTCSQPYGIAWGTNVPSYGNVCNCGDGGDCWWYVGGGAWTPHGGQGFNNGPANYAGHCGTNATVTTTTNYLRTIKVESGSATTLSDHSIGTATALLAADARTNVAKINSMKVTTQSNGNVVIDSYGGTNFSGTAYTQRTSTPSFATKGNNFGIIKAASGTITQGSTVDGFETSGF
jgi:hypothetical protein